MFENQGDTDCQRAFSFGPEVASRPSGSLEESITSVFLKRQGFQIFLTDSFFIMMKVFLFTQKISPAAAPCQHKFALDSFLSPGLAFLS